MTFNSAFDTPSTSIQALQVLEMWSSESCMTFSAKRCSAVFKLLEPMFHNKENEVEQFLLEVRNELIRAREKFPGDRIMTIALAEEFGELCKAVLDENSSQVYKEAVQTAVMAARVALDGDGSVKEWREARGLDSL